MSSPPPDPAPPFPATADEHAAGARLVAIRARRAIATDQDNTYAHRFYGLAVVVAVATVILWFSGAPAVARAAFALAGAGFLLNVRTHRLATSAAMPTPDEAAALAGYIYWDEASKLYRLTLAGEWARNAYLEHSRGLAPVGPKRAELPED